MAESTTSINWDDDGGDQQWEICNDNGFVYKRRRRRQQQQQQQQPPSPPSPNPEAETRRARKKKALLALKLKYQQELNQWRHLTSNLGPTTTPQPSSPPPSSPPPPPLPPPSTDIDELLLQVEAQESIMGKLSDLCDCVESLCDAAEERAAEALAELPVWSSPRRLVASITSLFSSS